jgi:four helix bundle protein
VEIANIDAVFMHVTENNASPAPEQNPQQKIQSHRELIVWQKAMKLAVAIYQLGSRLPSKEAFGLVAHMTRSAASIPANIAEGHARGTQRDYSHFLAIAKGSLMETETFVMLAVQLGYSRPIPPVFPRPTSCAGWSWIQPTP